MKYIIDRASIWDDRQPCEEAFQEEVIFTDERNVDDPMKNIHIGQSWYTEKGWFNHRVENGHIKRDRKETKWVIEINSLNQLLDFMNKYGKIVIYPQAYGIDNYQEITIYDDWIE